MANSVITRIEQFNADREPERRALKYAAMRRDPFAFFRGTAHLFYGDWPKGSPLDATPLTWACGDLHLENFGSFRGSNGLAYFDINDFDEAALAPTGRDLARLATSTVLAARLMRLPARETKTLWNQAHLAYSAALRHGKALWLERATSRGLIRQLFKTVKNRTQEQLLDERTTRRGGRRRLRVDGVHALRASPEQRQAVARALSTTRPAHADPAFFKVLDVARRIAGTGSLGLRRYSILIRGRDGRNGNVLLDLKQAAPSMLVTSLPARQPAWTSEAERVVTVQRRVQAVPPALLHPVRMGRHSFILRELQPAEDRLALEDARDKRRRLETSLRSMAEVVAWDQLRSAACHGSATNDEWVAFGHDTSWLRPLDDYSRQYADVVTEYWAQFAEWWDDTDERRRTTGERAG